ncbi:CorA family divalent cation transporter, partial [Chromobacterium amazonense]
NRLNLQMRKLTVLTMIFMPLTLIAGIYGMNFEHMPELKWHYGYHAVLGAMALLTSGLAWAFWKRKWI